MMFTSISFMFFLPIVFLIYWMISGKRIMMQNIFVVIASYVFYGAWDWRFLILIAFTSFCSWLSGLMIEDARFQKRRKFITGCNIVVNLLILGVFKYYNFFAQSFAECIGADVNDFVVINLILPVGISFYTFQALSYSIDVYRGKIAPTRDIVAFFAYVSFFPQLVAGPIERATSLLPQFHKERHFDYAEAIDGCRRMLWGFFKKMVIADNCAAYVNYVWTDYANQTSATLVIAAFFFSFQVYGDFSGYSDIAIGCSKLFGIRLNDNFKLPFFSRDIPELWRRWHISLNTWFVDYVYIPLGGSRYGKMIKLRNTVIIFLLSGLWHGANWTYVGWGMAFAIIFIPYVLFDLTKKYSNELAPNSILPSGRESMGMLMTFMVFTITVIIFRAPTIGDSFAFMKCIFTNIDLCNVYYEKYTVTPAVISIVVMMVTEWLQRSRRHGLDIAFIKQAWIRIPIYYILVMSIILFTGKSQTFIYFQF